MQHSVLERLEYDRIRTKQLLGTHDYSHGHTLTTAAAVSLHSKRVPAAGVQCSPSTPQQHAQPLCVHITLPCCSVSYCSTVTNALSTLKYACLLDWALLLSCCCCCCCSHPPGM
jgi:hypothetical protein